MDEEIMKEIKALREELRALREMQEDTFIVRIVSMNRITIPKKIVEKLGLKEGDYIAVKITKRGYW